MANSQVTWQKLPLYVALIDGGWPSGFRLEVFPAQNDVGFTVRFWKLGGAEVMHADTIEMAKERAEQMMTAYLAHNTQAKARKMKPAEDFDDLI